jgi:hypothetical protein
MKSLTETEPEKARFKEQFPTSHVVVLGLECLQDTPGEVTHTSSMWHLKV